MVSIRKKNEFNWITGLFDVEKCMICLIFFFSNRNCKQYYSTIAPEAQSIAQWDLSVIKQSFLIKKINFTFFIQMVFLFFFFFWFERHANKSKSNYHHYLLNWICLKTIHRCDKATKRTKQHMSKCIWFK